MRLLPLGRRTTRRRPSHRPPPGLVSAVVAACAAVTVAGCATRTGVRDDGAAPPLSAPASAVPLWPGYTPPAVSTPSEKEPDFTRYLPVDRVRVPSGGLAALSAKELLLNDPNVPAMVQRVISPCPDNGACSLREAVHRDLTGDGRDELVVAVDLPRVDRTLLQVYTASGHTARPVLIYWGPPGLTGETFGRDLLVTATGDDGRITTRFRWNGSVMAAVTPEGGTGRSGAQDPAVPDDVAPVPDGGGTADPGTRTETRTTR